MHTIPFRNSLVLGTLLTLFSGLLFVPFASAHSAGLQSQSPVILCVGESTLPSGWVVTNEYNNTATCPSNGGYVEVVLLPPNAPTRVCADSPVPAGFVITSYHTHPSICNTTNFPFNPTLFNTMTLTPLSSATMTVCASSPIPAGWVVIKEDTPSSNPSAVVNCGHTLSILQNAVVQKTIVPAGNDLYICDDSPIPSGYETLLTASLAACPADGNTGSELLVSSPPLSGERRSL